MKEIINIAKALSDQNRVRVLIALKNNELCACEITNILGLAQATVSKHMGILVNCGLVIARKEGKWMYYRLPCNADQPSRIVVDSLEMIKKYVKNNSWIKADKAKIKSFKCRIERK